MQIESKQHVARLRREGSALVLSIPQKIHQDLALKSGDLVGVSAVNGNLVARKVDLDPITRKLLGNGAKVRSL